MICFNYVLLFKKIFYLFFKRREGKGNKRERNINVWLPFVLPLLRTWLATQACALTGNQACSPMLCTELHQPGQLSVSFTHWILGE